MPILLQPVPRPKWPKAITTARILTRVQVALVMITGNCSFGIPLVAAIGWTATRLDGTEDGFGFAVPWAWAVGFAAILSYAIFTDRWAVRADRRALTTINIGTTVLLGFTALAIPIVIWLGDPELTMVVLLAAAPSLIVQAIVLRCVYGPDGRRWFASSEAAQLDESA